MKFRNQVIFSDDMIFGRVIIPITIPAGRALFLSSVPSHLTNIAPRTLFRMLPAGGRDVRQSLVCLTG